MAPKAQETSETWKVAYMLAADLFISNSVFPCFRVSRFQNNQKLAPITETKNASYVSSAHAPFKGPGSGVAVNDCGN
jgi:hypothetical protein